MGTVSVFILVFIVLVCAFTESHKIITTQKASVNTDDVVYTPSICWEFSGNTHNSDYHNSEITKKKQIYKEWVENCKLIDKIYGVYNKYEPVRAYSDKYKSENVITLYKAS